MSLFSIQFDVEVFLGMVACPPCTSDLLRWPGYAVLVFPFIEIVQSDMHTSISPVATYGYSLTCHIWKVSCLSSKWVWVWYIHAAYSWPWLLLLLIWEQTWLICAEMWIVSISLSETKIPNFPRGYTSRPPYKRMLCVQHTRLPSKFFSALHA